MTEKRLAIISSGVGEIWQKLVNMVLGEVYLHMLWTNKTEFFMVLRFFKFLNFSPLFTFRKITRGVWAA